MAILYHKKFKSGRKIAIFKNTTFELFVDIGKQIKTCPCGQVLKLWLRSVCSFRAELIEIGQEIDKVKEKLNLPNLH